MHRPTTFGELISRLAPDMAADVYHVSPVLATAVEMNASNDGKQRPFWVLVHSVSDRGVKLLHARALRANNVSVRIQGGSGEIVQAIFAVAGSQPRGELYETTAQFQHVGLDVGQLS